MITFFGQRDSISSWFFILGQSRPKEVSSASYTAAQFRPLFSFLPFVVFRGAASSG
jgi:hypothetical protein